MVGLGTWKLGLPETGDGSRAGEKEAYAIFDRAMELGVTFWDTANRYNNGAGNSERLIGRWLKANPDQRRNVVIATKMAGGMDGRTPNHSRLSRQHPRFGVCLPGPPPDRPHRPALFPLAGAVHSH
jgi:aryl-alcohol dehydrogenase-like predicted oxidoreductase